MEEKVLRSRSKLGISFKCKSGATKVYVFGDTVDELIDNLVKLKDGKFITSFIDDFPNLKDEQLKKLDKGIIACQKPRQISSYAVKRKELSNTQDVEDALISLCSKSSTYRPIVDFARTVVGANISKLEDFIIKSSDTTSILEFAREVAGANIERLQEAFLMCDISPLSLLTFLQIVPNADPYKFKESIICSDNLFTVIRFFSEFPNVVTAVEIDELQEKVIASQSAEYIYQFATEVRNANIDKLRCAINSLNRPDKDSYLYFYFEYFWAKYGKHKKLHFFSKKK